IVKIVNALSGSSEIGGPAVCAYLLGHDDHYTDRTFKVFYWKSYVKTARNQCGAEMQSRSDDVISHDRPAEASVDESGEHEKVMLGITADGVVAVNKVNDYCCRPAFFESWTLYDFLVRTDVRKLRKTERFQTHSRAADVDDDGFQSSGSSEADSSDTAHKFVRGHALRSTHGVYVRRSEVPYVLNFVGGSLPRPDRGDRDEYCFVMLVLFAPGGWRRGSDLMSDGLSFTEIFQRTAFASQHLRIMAHMNVLYECLDARDDFSA
ncbi:hypothetical protein FKP32DRAFT_1553053, partial [Trametes sanguinea]